MNFIGLDAVITVILCLDVGVQWHRQTRLTHRVPVALLSRPAWAYQWWFGIDLLAALPFTLLFGPTGWSLLGLLKLARVAQRTRQWRHQEVQHAHVLRLVFFAYWLLLTAHWLACGWLALDGHTTMAGNVAQGFSRYLRALYWTITTLTTVGYGDLTPETDGQIAYTMMVMLLGVGVYGYVIGNVASLLANIDVAKSHYLEKMERLAAFMRYRNIPPILQRRLRDYYTYLWENRLGYDESTVMAELPDSLRTEVALFLRRGFIEHAPLFRGASHELIREIALQLRSVVFTPGDYIIRAGHYGRHMYFISRGTVEIIAADDHTVMNTLHDGDFFGELALLFSQPRTASVRAVDYCDLYALDKDTFDHVLARYPNFAAHIREMAERRSPQPTQA
jgi:voltage-gated potassium channel